MDLDRIERTLIDFETALDKASALRPNIPAQNQVKLKAALVRLILESLEPGLGDFKMGGTAGWARAREASVHGRGLVSVMRQGTDWFTPNAPALRASDMHPLVWPLARTFWVMKAWPQAVETSYRAIQTNVQIRVGRTDVDGVALFNLAFGLKEVADGIRLWRPGDRSTETWKSKQQGLLSLSQAVALGIRNVITHAPHGTLNMKPIEALEMLATLSLLAKWVDDTEAVGGVVKSSDSR